MKTLCGKLVILAMEERVERMGGAEWCYPNLRKLLKPTKTYDLS